MAPELTYVVESLVTIAVFGVALYVATRGVRWLGNTRGRGPIEVLARQSLDARRAIYLVRIGKRVLILGAADGSLTRLGTTSFASIEGDLAPPPEGASKTFRDALARALGRKE